LLGINRLRKLEKIRRQKSHGEKLAGNCRKSAAKMLIKSDASKSANAQAITSETVACQPKVKSSRVTR
jgi:hypothetical protein